ncbi:hypothetical protein BHS09_34205 [Myxococcus xanthus]|uniref:Uncharacterized protein n=1 Tax=Myxococcus xanthus TaxID=34 RepID=A0AAE6G6U0_MYXXA|nr:hypothetical protein [Myxococcus xanthus]QDE71639.1 hypothetical protein BHS09_34205 [Myxococcus xanthus]QDE78920.1 hypothetical protein BHS08_34230 [Myxococcus xanthus]
MFGSPRKGEHNLDRGAGIVVVSGKSWLGPASRFPAAAKEAAPPPADLPPGVSAVLWKLSVPAGVHEGLPEGLRQRGERRRPGDGIAAFERTLYSGNARFDRFLTDDSKALTAYQVQLGRVALVRDMINGCIENPARGRPLADGDPRMRAVEAYIYAKREGVKLDSGKK